MRAGKIALIIFIAVDIVAALFMLIMIVIMINLPLASAGSPDEPAPPTAIM